MANNTHVTRFNFDDNSKLENILGRYSVLIFFIIWFTVEL